MFTDVLRAKGWAEVAGSDEYVKGDWTITWDTGHWLILSTKRNPRVFDVPVPGDYESVWTVNLIEHLCRMDDERQQRQPGLS